MSDQTTGGGPVDPDTPAGSSETAEPAPEPQEQPKSPDEESDEAREGGTPTHAKGETGGDDESQEG